MCIKVKDHSKNSKGSIYINTCLYIYITYIYIYIYTYNTITLIFTTCAIAKPVRVEQVNRHTSIAPILTVDCFINRFSRHKFSTYSKKTQEIHKMDQNGKIQSVAPQNSWTSQFRMYFVSPSDWNDPKYLKTSVPCWTSVHRIWLSCQA